MTMQVMVIAGPAGTGKTTQVLSTYQEVLGRAEPGSALWLGPNWRAVEEVRRRLLSARVGYLAPGVMTFDRFAEGVVKFSGRQARLIDRQMQRYLIWELVEERRKAERFRYFALIANTPGFVDLLVEWIREMKRLEIWPEQFRQACQARQMSEKDQELLDIYEAYQNFLTEHSLYDGEGRFWLARTLLAEGALLPPAQRQRLKLVVVDGFTDFTRTQHEILKFLACRAEQMLITLLLEKDSERKELFAKPEKTLRELRRRHEGLEVEWLGRSSPPAWPALDHIERYLFANPKDYQPLPQKAARMEILAAASQLAEIELLAQRIKRLLTEGEPGRVGGPIRPEDILVLFRSLEPVSVLVREVFGRYGIPFVLESSAPLRSARSLMALVELVRLEVEDWPLRRLLAVLSQSYFQPDWPEWQQGRAGWVADRLIRGLGTSQGREELFQALGRLIDHAEDCSVGKDRPAGGGNQRSQDESGTVDRPRTGFRRDAQTTLALLQRLSQALDALPQKAPLTEWAKAWRRLAEEVGVFRAIRRAPLLDFFGDASAGEENQQESFYLEELAWRELESLLASADRLWSWGGQAAPERNREEALAVLTDLLSRAALPSGIEEAGRVRVLSVWAARSLRAPYVFLAGLSEKAFPPPEPSGRLYNEQETQELIRQGLPLAARRDRSCEEMLLFYEAITRAARQLVLSYPGLDESAQALAPSPYLDELEAVCSPGQIDKKELFALRPIPDSGELFCRRDFRVRAMADAVQGDVSLLAGLMRSEGEGFSAASGASGSKGDGRTGNPSAFNWSFDQQEMLWESPLCGVETPLSTGENILAAVRLMADRSQIESFGPGEGMLQSGVIVKALQARFRPDYVYSATALESYASCPFRFLLEKVLGLAPLEEWELEEDPRERGLWVHRILAEVHRRLNDRFGRPASPTELPEADWQPLLQEVIEETFADKPAAPVRAALQEVHRRLIRQWLAEYRQHHQKYEEDKRWADFAPRPQPAYFEITFGGFNPSTSYGPLELPSPHPVEDDLPMVRISGRIDRIDLGQAAGKVVFNVLDYKTGKTTWPTPQRQQERLKTGVLLQLPLYLLAAERIILAHQQARPWFAGYWNIKEPGDKTPVSGFTASKIAKGNLAEKEEWASMRQIVVQVVFRLVRAMRSGQFPVYSPAPDCTRNCPWKTACRIQQIWALEKSWSA